MSDPLLDQLSLKSSPQISPIARVTSVKNSVGIFTSVKSVLKVSYSLTNSPTSLLYLVVKISKSWMTFREAEEQQWQLKTFSSARCQTFCVNSVPVWRWTSKHQSRVLSIWCPFDPNEGAKNDGILTLWGCSLYHFSWSGWKHCQDSGMSSCRCRHWSRS